MSRRRVETAWPSVRGIVASSNAYVLRVLIDFRVDLITWSGAVSWEELPSCNVKRRKCDGITSPSIETV